MDKIKKIVKRILKFFKNVLIKVERVENIVNEFTYNMENTISNFTRNCIAIFLIAGPLVFAFFMFALLLAFFREEYIVYLYASFDQFTLHFPRNVVDPYGMTLVTVKVEVLFDYSGQFGGGESISYDVQYRVMEDIAHVYLFVFISFFL